MSESARQRLRLRPAQKLKQPREFNRIRAGGLRLANGCLILNWAPLPAGSTARLGVVTGRKIGGSVVRSRARRLLRESFRRHQHDLRAPVDLVLVARPSIAGKGFEVVEADLLNALRRATLLKEPSA